MLLGPSVTSFDGNGCQIAANRPPKRYKTDSTASIRAFDEGHPLVSQQNSTAKLSSMSAALVCATPQETALDVAKRRAAELSEQGAGFDASFAVGDREQEKDVPAVVTKASQLARRGIQQAQLTAWGSQSAEVLTLFAHFNTDFFARHDKIREAWRRGREITGLLDKNAPLPTLQDEKERESKGAEVMAKLLELESYLKQTRIELDQEEEVRKGQEDRKAD